MTVAVAVGLTALQRTLLERLVIRARLVLEHDLAAQAAGRFGIHLDGTIEDEAALPDDTTDRNARLDLEDIVAHLCALGEDAPGAVARLLREAAFTHLNRLVAIRIAEAIGLLPESLAAGPQSRGFKDLGEIMPMLAGDYRSYVRLCGDELAADAPALFDPRNPLLALQPSTAAFDELVELVADPEAAEIWLAPDTLGWAYQFFNTAEERREMREATAPRNARELAVRNQFFTPRYVVEFLVQNTIGRRLIEGDPSSSLLAELPLLVDPATEPGPPVDLNEVKCLDPACGSGHFLLGCYDLLERAWELAGVPPSSSAPKIVASLWGVDIDARCAQVASAAIVLRARRHCRDLELPRPNIITARGLPSGSAALPPDLHLTSEQRSLIERVSAVLRDAPLLGTLLKAEQALEQEVRYGMFGGPRSKEGMLELTDEVADATEHELLGHLQAIADQASSSVAERLFAAEAEDALRLVDVCRTRFDAVLMNPPFGEPVPETKPYLLAAYPWLPGRVDLYAAFVGRGLELCKPDGYLGAITSRAGLFLSTFEPWRRDVLLSNRLAVVADLGYRVMHQAKVEAAAYVLGPGRPSPGAMAVFVRILKEPDRALALAEAVAVERSGGTDPRVFHVPIEEFEAVPGTPVAYSMTASVRRLFTDLPRLEGNDAEVRVGLQTGEDFRFVRAVWEVDPRRVARSREDTNQGKRWCLFAKGGEYSPYWTDVHLLVEYEEDASRLRSHSGAVMRNPGYFFRPGLTWSLRTNSALGVRVLPAGCVFSNKGNIVYTSDELTHLAWLNSRLVRLLVDSVAASGDEDKTDVSRSYEVGLLQRLPSPIPVGLPDDVRDLARSLAEIVASFDHTNELTGRFIAPATVVGSFKASVTLGEQDRISKAVDAINTYGRIDRYISTAVDPDGDVEESLIEASGPLVAELPDLLPSDFEHARKLLTGDVAAAVEAATLRVGVARWVGLQHQVIDRLIEMSAIALQANPTSLAELAADEGLVPEDTFGRAADDLFSYLVGCAFGRWDLRIGRDPSIAPLLPGLFEPVPLCPPGMLVGADGFPPNGTPDGYPIDLPPGLLVDEPGHTWDVEERIWRSAAVLFDDSATVMAELLDMLGRRSVRDHLRRQFFKDHLGRYSKSRRKAPIYWPLTTKSKAWGVWVYAPRLCRQTLYAVAGEARRRERLAEDAIIRLRDELATGASGRTARKVTEELDAEEKLAEELRWFQAEAERVAGLGWEPDFNDGIVLCAAPLADLLPSWSEAKKARAELRKGNYDWATVAGWADRL